MLLVNTIGAKPKQLKKVPGKALCLSYVYATVNLNNQSGIIRKKTSPSNKLTVNMYTMVATDASPDTLKPLFNWLYAKDSISEFIRRDSPRPS